jgi:predicted nucleic acid-binding protein
MGPATGLSDAAARLVADASTIINLIATGSARAIVSALPNRMLVVDVVLRELETGRARGRETSERLKELALDGVLELVELGDDGMPCFEDLVIGPATATLDDGEAATIAYAVAHGDTALIDERKATRICAERYPQLRTACTVDVLLHQDVQRQLGAALLSDSVFRALRDGRMGVMPHHLDLVVGLIGEERAALCPSIPRRARRSRDGRQI